MPKFPLSRPKFITKPAFRSILYGGVKQHQKGKRRVKIFADGTIEPISTMQPSHGPPRSAVTELFRQGTPSGVGELQPGRRTVGKHVIDFLFAIIEHFR